MDHPPEPPTRILIAVPSTGRPTAQACVASLQHQVDATRLEPGEATVAVFLNNVEEGVDVERASASATTCHLRAGGIADVRNAVLDVALERGYSHVLFFDDDQVACDGWLQSFLTALRRGGFDVLLGPVDVAFPPRAPRWATDNPHLFRGGAPLADGPFPGHPYSGNTLITLGSPALAGVRFAATLNAGGEDTHFFHRLRRRGARIGGVAGARAVEIQQAGRLTVRGLASRRLAQGRTARRLERLGVFDDRPSPALRHPARLAARLVPVAVRLLTLRSATRPALEALFEGCFVAGVCVEEVVARVHGHRQQEI
jgi:hypothetical protein